MHEDTQKTNTNLTIDKDLLDWVDENVGIKRFASRSHAVNYAILMLKIGSEIRETDIKILAAMRGSREAMETNDILSRFSPPGEPYQHLNMDELQDRLKLMDGRYVRTHTKPGVNGNGVYKAELIELGRQVLRERGFSVY